MSIYLVLYHDDAGKTSLFKRMELEEEFSEFNREIGNSVIDGGSPIIDGMEITADGSRALKTEHGVDRYLLIEAQDINEAIEKAKGAPILRRGGRAEVLEVSMASY